MPYLFRRRQRDSNRFKVWGKLLLLLLESKHVFLQIPSRVQRPMSNVYVTLRTLDFGRWTLDNSYSATLVISASPTPSSLPAPLPATFLLINSTSRQSDCSSRTRTLND